MKRFPGEPPRRWAELTDEQRAWVQPHLPFDLAQRTPSGTPAEFVERIERGAAVLARYRPTDPLRVPWPKSLSSCLTK